MEAKQWFSAVLFTLLLAGLSINLLRHDSKSLSRDLRGSDEQNPTAAYISTSFQWIQSMIPFVWDGRFSGPDVAEQTGGRPIAPNLATCHKSLTDAGRPVYCCPPKPESEESVVDFKFPSPSAPKRIRRPAHLVDEDYVAKYHRAVTLMKQLDSSDPRNFMRQANIHCIFCTGAYNQVNSTHLLNIHRSWFFFPWHRMMIYFHERILGKLIGDENFALPYWNWDNPPGMVIPHFYKNGSFVDKDRDHTHHSQIVDDNFDYVERGLGNEGMTEFNLHFMYHQMVSGAKKVELFMGCKRTAGEEGECDGPGTIEVAPHNALHTWVGSNFQPERENMGAFYSAARDPIFYAHHANIDRLWTVWRRLRGNVPEIVDPAWHDSYFYFHDENAQLVRMKIRDSLDMEKLGYGYEEIDHPWLNARPKPSVPPKIAKAALKMRELNQNALQSPYFGPQGRTLDSTIRAKVQRPKRYRTSKEKKEEEEVLVVYGIDIKKDMYVKFDVYVNVVDEMNTGPEGREFAGTFVNVRHGVKIVLKEGDSKMRMKSTLKLGISELLEDLEADEDESVWVTLVPRGGTCVNTTVEGIRIEYMR